MLSTSIGAASGWVRSSVRAFRDDEAATVVEYAFLLAVTLTVVMGAISLLGLKNSAVWTSVGQAMQNVL